MPPISLPTFKAIAIWYLLGLPIPPCDPSILNELEISLRRLENAIMASDKPQPQPWNLEGQVRSGLDLLQVAATLENRELGAQLAREARAQIDRSLDAVTQALG